MIKERLSSEQWTRFWEKGTPTTFFGSFDKNYDGKIADFWNSQFDKLLEHARILDLATGNGALAVLAAGYSEQQKKTLSIIGIDSAEIDPSGIVRSQMNSIVRGKIKFHSNRNMENTELEDHSVDLVISQFGFEYGDPEKVVEEASRVLKRKASIALLMHRRGSVIHRQSKDALKEVNQCNESELHALLSELLRRLQKVSDSGGDPLTDTRAAKLRDRVNKTTGRLHEEMENFKDPRHIGYFLTNSMVIFRPQFANHSLEDKLNLLREVREETDSYESRMKDLQSAVLSPTDIDKLGKLMIRQGFQVTLSEPLKVDEGIFCHKFVAERGPT